MAVLTYLRTKQDSTPVLILTARDSLEDRVAGLNAGADDYLLKPFAMPELVARLKALLRRPAGALGTCLEAGDIRFDTVHREVSVGGQPLSLSRRELALLEHLMRRAGRVIPRDVLEERIYGFDEEVGPNTLEVLVHRLRKKLGDIGSQTSIHTLRGVGYLLAEETT
jgi:DNA-binding response OmpR family regulator